MKSFSKNQFFAHKDVITQFFQLRKNSIFVYDPDYDEDCFSIENKIQIKPQKDWQSLLNNCEHMDLKTAVKNTLLNYPSIPNSFSINPYTSDFLRLIGKKEFCQEKGNRIYTLGELPMFLKTHYYDEWKALNMAKFYFYGFWLSDLMDFVCLKTEYTLHNSFFTIEEFRVFNNILNLKQDWINYNFKNYREAINFFLTKPPRDLPFIPLNYFFYDHVSSVNENVNADKINLLSIDINRKDTFNRIVNFSNTCTMNPYNYYMTEVLHLSPKTIYSVIHDLIINHLKNNTIIENLPINKHKSTLIVNNLKKEQEKISIKENKLFYDNIPLFLTFKTSHLDLAKQRARKMGLNSIVIFNLLQNKINKINVHSSNKKISGFIY